MLARSRVGALCAGLARAGRTSARLALILALGCTPGTVVSRDAGRGADARPDARVADAAIEDDAGSIDCASPGACADARCDGLACDGAGGVCDEGACRAPLPSTETRCANALDDDGDLMIDCDDPDCDCGLRVEIGAVQSVTSFGGDGATASSGICPNGEVIVGLSGRSGPYLDRVQPVCAPLVVSEVSATRVQLETGAHHVVDTAGGPGGGPFEDHCPDDMVVTRVSVTSGDWIDSVTARCEALFAQRDGDTWSIYGDGLDFLPTRGGDGPSPGEVTCTDGGFTRLDVEHAVYVDRLTPYCHDLTIVDGPPS